MRKHRRLKRSSTTRRTNSRSFACKASELTSPRITCKLSTRCPSVVVGMFCSFFCHLWISQQAVHFLVTARLTSGVRPAMVSCFRDIPLASCLGQFPSTFRRPLCSRVRRETLARAPLWRTRPSFCVNESLNWCDIHSLRRHLPSKKKLVSFLWKECTSFDLCLCGASFSGCGKSAETPSAT